MKNTEQQDSTRHTTPTMVQTAEERATVAKAREEAAVDLDGLNENLMNKIPDSNVRRQSRLPDAHMNDFPTSATVEADNNQNGAPEGWSYGTFKQALPTDGFNRYQFTIDKITSDIQHLVSQLAETYTQNGRSPPAFHFASITAAGLACWPTVSEVTDFKKFNIRYGRNPEALFQEVKA